MSGCGELLNLTLHSYGSITWQLVHHKILQTTHISYSTELTDEFPKIAISNIVVARCNKFQI